MKFLADESVDRQIVEGLRQAGYEVDSITELAPGSSDELVLERANQAKSILITADKDFGELMFRLRRLSPGVLLIRLAGLTSSQKSAMVLRSINNHLPELLGALTVITPAGIRIRRHNLS